ncbi:MAG: FAD-dependent oxidoreductase [Pseudomonadota bacterium]
MSQETPADVTVLGAGIIGICCALNALEKGLTVQLIDRQPPGEATSYGNAGVISPWSIVPQCTPGVWTNVPKWLLDPKGPVKLRWQDLPGILPWVFRFLRNTTPERFQKISDAMALLMQDNVDAYRRYLAGTGHEGLIVDAMTVIVYRGAARPKVDDLQFCLRQERGGEVEFIGATDLHDLEPDLAPEYRAAALIKNQARALDPGKICKVLAAKAEILGANFKVTEVSAVRPDENGGITLHTDTGDLAVRKLILAGGIWSAGLLKPLGVSLPLIAERGYHLEFQDPGVTINHSINDASAKVIVSSMQAGVRIAGTAEFADVDAPPNYARARALAPIAKRLFPALNTASPKEWMGIRPSFPDNLPAIGPVKGIPNIISAFGHSHYGLGMAPGTARLAVESMLGTLNYEISAFSEQRFRS